mmetsp:Transcript_7896/g.13343  ORF Transcript_7896/g.13343 Transcript_7896/m.13343 type:complete len:116 (+) Transcript_7896:311-658(+)
MLRQSDFDKVMIIYAISVYAIIFKEQPVLLKTLSIGQHPSHPRDCKAQGHTILPGEESTLAVRLQNNFPVPESHSLGWMTSCVSFPSSWEQRSVDWLHLVDDLQFAWNGSALFFL